MIQRIALLLTVAGSAACGARTASPVAQAVALAVPAGVVALSADSPMLAHITRARVTDAELPTDEMIAPGKIEANPNRVSKIVLPVTGRVTSVRVKVGDSVAQDQPLLSIQSPDADAAESLYLSSQAGVTQAQANLTKARADYDRSADLFAHDAVAKKDMLANENAVVQAKATLEQAQASLEQALGHLTVLGLNPGDSRQQVVVRAPIAGKVLDLNIVPGEFRNDANAVLMTIADLSTVWVTSQVPESYIRFVQVGERVEISLVAYPGEAFEGRVSRIADTVDPQTRTVKVQAEMRNGDGRFRPEMFGSIHHVESTRKMAVLPIGAVVQSNGRSIVFVETAPGRFEQRQVSLGKRAGEVIRVLGGVKPGESVVVDGAMLLEGLVKRT